MGVNLLRNSRGEISSEISLIGFQRIGIVSTSRPAPGGGGGGGCEPFNCINSDDEDLVKSGPKPGAEYIPNMNAAVDEWVVEDPVYYIRSSVLGGQVFSETNSTGKKLKTFVTAAGTTIAWQTLDYTYNPSGNQTVYFSNEDASGMSRRLSYTSANAIIVADDETDGIEIDALGSNVRTFSPYFVWNLPPDPDGGSSGILNLDGGDAPRINGQRVTGTIDGIRVPWGQIQMELDSARIGGAFGIAEMAAKRSRPRIRDFSVGDRSFSATASGARQAIGEAIETGNTLVRNIIVDNSWVSVGNIASILSSFHSQDEPLSPLDAEKDTAFRNALSELADRLSISKFGKNCKTKVLDKLAKIEGFDLNKFMEFLRKDADLYDGERSTAPVADYSVPGSGYKITIAKRFKEKPGLHAFVGVGPNVTNFTVFFDPDFIETKQKTSVITGEKISGITTSNLAFAFHEGLHGYGNSIGKLNKYFDNELFDSLGIKRASGSIDISNYIEEHCIKGVSSK